MKKLCSYLLLLLSIQLIFLGCSKPDPLAEGQGYINVEGGKIWYRVVGTGNKTPLLLLHGGPGVPSYYLKPMSELGKDRKVIFFDQLGCGKSDHITDTTLMTVDHYVEEVNTVVKHFGLKEYYLYGQSWGTMLGTEFYLKHPEGIKAVLLSSPAISIPRWLKDADSLISLLPDSVAQAIRTNEKNKTYNAPEYKKGVQLFYENFVARKVPWSADIDSAFLQIGKQYEYMNGPSEFTIVGPLKTFDRTDRLHEIKVPTLFITGEFDEACPNTVKYYQSLVPGAKIEIIPGAGHLTMQDAKELHNKVVSDFLADLEK
ncbi:MAG: proline iminopeptidase-family hydrolase [Bacteroidetes bacterium]|nr:proline iminopeptidase-family hydrolase [Bacteroidota bacterium]